MSSSCNSVKGSLFGVKVNPDIEAATIPNIIPSGYFYTSTKACTVSHST